MEGTTVKKQGWKNNDLFTKFGIILGAFWEPKGLHKSSKILDAILEPKRGPGKHPLGSARRNARGAGGRKKGGAFLRLIRRPACGGKGVTKRLIR